jgi:hypothetical protein
MSITWQNTTGTERDVLIHEAPQDGPLGGTVQVSQTQRLQGDLWAEVNDYWIEHTPEGPPTDDGEQVEPPKGDRTWDDVINDWVEPKLLLAEEAYEDAHYRRIGWKD